jgi:dimethylglycine dehydrogenase
MIEHARVVIVGGGMMGCGLLYHLAEEGWTDAVLIEKAELTSGSTWHAAGQCPSFAGSYNLAKIHHYGNTLYPKLEEMTGQATGWHGVGGIRLAFTDIEQDWFRHVADYAPNIGFDLEVIPPEEIKRRVPYMELHGVVAGALTTMDGHVDPASCCQALAVGARQMGATIIRNNRVLGISALPSGEWRVQTEQGDITCEHVVNAAGCYARLVAQWVGTDVPITNMLHQYFVTDTVPEFAARDDEMPVIRDPAASSYYRQEQKSGLIGIYETAHAHAAEAWAPKGAPEWESESELFAEDYERILPYMEKVLERVPMWSELGIKRVVHGAIPHTPDANPLLGPAAGVKNYWMCNGSSIGIAQGAGAGKYLAQWMVHGDAEINMGEFDPRRFGGWADEDYTRAKSFEDYNRMYALPAPGEELDTGRPRRTSSIYETLNAKGAVHTVAFGWERPKWFSSDGREEDHAFRRNNIFEVVAAECAAVRQRCGMMDMSSFAKFDVSGAGAEAMLNGVFANRMPKRQGGIALAHGLSFGGGIETECTITRLADDKFFVITGAAWEDRDFDRLNWASGDDTDVSNVTDDWGALVLAGPRARDVLGSLTDADLSNDAFAWLTGQEIEVAGIAVRALRVNYVGELGWEIYAPMARLPELYAALSDGGAEDFGAYAMNSLRMEKAYKAMSLEMTNEVTVFEAGLNRFTNLDKGDFTGRDASLKRRDAGNTLEIIYAEVATTDRDVLGGEPVFAGDSVVGVTTSGGYGHATGKSLFFAYVTPDALDKDLEIEILGERFATTTLAAPAYDPKNERLRA